LSCGYGITIVDAQDFTVALENGYSIGSLHRDPQSPRRGRISTPLRFISLQAHTGTSYFITFSGRRSKAWR
jgi:hypothetical protein